MKSSGLIVMIVILALIYGAFFFTSPALISPDELSYKFFSEHLADRGTIFYHPPGDEIMGSRGFLPRKFHYNVRGEVVSRKPPGLIFIWALFQKIAGKKFSFWLFPLLALADLALFYRICRHVFAEKELRLAALLLLASMPVFLLRSYAYSPTMLNLLIFFASLLLLRRVFLYGRWYHYLGMGLVLGLLVWVRLTSILLWIPLGVCFLVERKKVRSSRLLWLGAGCAVIIILYFLYNHLVFGNFLASGYTVHYLPSGAGTMEGGLQGLFRIIEFHPTIWLLHIISTPLAFMLAFPPLVLSVAGFYLMLREKYPRWWFYFGGGLFVVLIVFFANFETYGYYSREISLRSSFLRYCLPALVFLPIGAAFFLSKLSSFFSQALIIIVIFNIIIAFSVPLGMLESFVLGSYYTQVKEFILDNTDQRSVILSSYWDKLAFPERLVFSNLRDKDEKFLLSIISRIEGHGYKGIYIEHEYDRDFFEPILAGRIKKKISGPGQLHGFLNWITPPSQIYPVDLYELAADGANF